MVYSEGGMWVAGSSYPCRVTIMPISSVETRTIFQYYVSVETAQQ